jgi:hypothetical protein
MIKFYWLILALLAVWRITHLLNAEDGPWDLFARLRQQAGNRFWGQLLDCFYCLSIWTAAPFAVIIGDSWKERLLLWPALSAGAILLQCLTSRQQNAPPAVYYEDEEKEDVLLRQEKGTVPSEHPDEPQS